MTSAPSTACPSLPTPSKRRAVRILSSSLTAASQESTPAVAGCWTEFSERNDGHAGCRVVGEGPGLREKTRDRPGTGTGPQVALVGLCLLSSAVAPADRSPG